MGAPARQAGPRGAAAAAGRARPARPRRAAARAGSAPREQAVFRDAPPERDPAAERAKQRTRRLRRDAKAEAEEEIEECNAHISRVLHEAEQHLLATRGVEYLNSASAPSAQTVAADLREGMRAALHRIMPKLTTSFLPTIDATMVALHKARPPERDPESADLLAMLAVMRELTLELFEAELPSTVRALDAASRARSALALRDAVRGCGEPMHEVALTAGQLLADMEAPKNGALTADRLRLLARTCLARQCAREAATRDVLPSQIDGGHLYAHEATVIKELVGVAGFMARDRRRALLMKIIHEGWAGEGVYRDDEADKELGGNAAPPATVSAAFDRLREAKKKRSAADRSAEAIAKGNLEDVEEESAREERLNADGSPYVSSDVLDQLGVMRESENEGIKAAERAVRDLEAKDRRLVRPGRLLDSLWELSVKAIGTLPAGSNKMDKTLDALEELMTDTVWCLERVAEFEEESAPCAGPASPTQ